MTSPIKNKLLDAISDKKQSILNLAELAKAKEKEKNKQELTYLTELDKNNAEDILIIAIEMLHEIK
jgi:c-di-GMP-related signal transduction protein